VEKKTKKKKFAEYIFILGLNMGRVGLRQIRIQFYI